MSQALGASSQANQRQIDELMEEIAFQKVLLSSIDDSVENREVAENEVRVEIKTLEKQLRTLRREHSTVKSASQSTTIPSQSAASSSLPSNPRNDAAMDNFFTAGSHNGYQGTLAEGYIWTRSNLVNHPKLGFKIKFS
jgi:phage shock protein A